MVDLTPEERRRIYLEEKERMEVQKKLKKGKDISIVGNIIAVVGSFFLIIGLFVPWVMDDNVRLNAFLADSSSPVPIILVAIAMFSILIAILGIALKKKLGPILTFTGILGIIIPTIHAIELKSNLISIPLLKYHPKMGTGFSICVFGGIIIFIGSLGMILSNMPRRPQ